MKNKYVEAEMEIINFDAEDAIVTEDVILTSNDENEWPIQT